MIYVNDPDFVLHVGDVREVLAGLPAESVHCVVTSPPYWGLRDYGTGLWEGGDPACDHVASRATQNLDKLSEQYRGGGKKASTEGAIVAQFRDVCGKCGARRVDRQLGLDATPDEFVANMVAVFREVRRVLRRDGTCWVNLGDSYAGAGYSNHDNGEVGGLRREDGGSRHHRTNTGLKPKDLVGIPWRVAFALQADGWYLRSDIVWSKPNPMPESVTDRPTKSHEYVFLLSRSPRYFFDQEAVREPQAWYDHHARYPAYEAKWTAGRDQRANGKTGTVASPGNPAGRNVRSVWEIATQPYPDAHFATFPEELPRRAILAGTSEYGVCPECGAPWERETDVDYTDAGANNNSLKRKGGGDAEAAMSSRPYETRKLKNVTTTGWRPSCSHGHHGPVPATVLDPFMGSGTTAHVARKLGRRSIGIELNPEYAALCARRLQQLSLLA